MKKLGLVAGILALFGFAACQLLLPEGMVIRGPILSSLLGRGIEAPTTDVVQGRFQAPEGYQVELFAEGIPNARVLRFSPGGSLIVSQPRKGALTLVLSDQDGDGRSDGQREIITGLDQPHGFDFRWDGLYVGETGAIARLTFSESGPDTLTVSDSPNRIVEGIPPGENHWFPDPPVRSGRRALPPRRLKLQRL